MPSQCPRCFICVALFNLQKNSDRKLWEATQLVRGNRDSSSAFLDFKAQAANPYLMYLRGAQHLFYKNFGCYENIMSGVLSPRAVPPSLLLPEGGKSSSLWGVFWNDSSLLWHQSPASICINNISTVGFLISWNLVAMPLRELWCHLIDVATRRRGREAGGEVASTEGLQRAKNCALSTILGGRKWPPLNEAQDG